MPFQSKAQMRLFLKKEHNGELSRGTFERWLSETKDHNKLPEHKKKKRKMKSAMKKIGFESGLRKEALFGFSKKDKIRKAEAEVNAHVHGKRTAFANEMNSKENIDKANVIQEELSHKHFGKSVKELASSSEGASKLDSMMHHVFSHPHFKAIMAKHGISNYNPYTGDSWVKIDEGHPGAKRLAALTKHAGADALTHATETAGLAIMSAPSILHFARGKNRDKSQDKLHALGLAGLGTLAAPALAHYGGVHVSDGAAHGANIAGLSMLAAPSLHHFMKKKADREQDRMRDECRRDALKATPLGERLLADSDGHNESPLVATLALRRISMRLKGRNPS